MIHVLSVPKTDTLKTGTLTRSAQLDRAGLDKEKRTVRVRFSTETPVQRWFGTEVLSHDAGACNLDRMNAGAAVLCEHDPMQRCGITESATITPDKNGEAVVRFARTPLGDQCMNEVEDGTLRWMSVGYVVNRFEVDEKEESYRAIDWEPLEASFVGIPADTKAKVLRSNEVTKEHESKVIMKRSLLLATEPAIAPGGGAPNIITKEDFSRELDEAREILTVSAQYQRTHPEVTELAEKALKDKTPIREFQRAIIALVAKPSKESKIIIPKDQPTLGDRSVGGRFVASDSYKAGATRKIGRGNHIVVDLPDMFQFRAAPEMQQRVNFGISTSDVSGSTDIGGASGANIDIYKNFNLLNQQPLVVADLFMQATTTGDTVRFIRELSYTQAAARVAEASGKPQAQLDVGVVNATVEKTSVYLDTTEEMMNDWAQAQSYINGRLAYMVQSKEDDYLLNGTGISQITGLLNTAGIQTVSGAANTVDSFARAKAYVEGAAGAGFANCDAFVINPLDWLAIRLTKDANGQYLFGGPAYAPYGVGGYSNVGMMWGTPVVTTVAQAQGTSIGGAFRNGAAVWRRQGLTLRTTDSDASKFLSGIMTIVADSRFAFTVFQPNRFCSVTGIPAVN